MHVNPGSAPETPESRCEVLTPNANARRKSDLSLIPYLDLLDLQEPLSAERQILV